MKRSDLKTLKYLAKEIRRKSSVILALFLILLSSFFIFSKLEEVMKINLNQTNITTTTRPFQENVSIEVPEGVLRIEKGGRIRTV